MVIDNGLRRLRPFQWNGRDGLLAAALFVGTALLLAAAAPGQRALALDAATWDSLAVGLTRGEIPYRDVFLHKTPGAAILGACSAKLATWIGLEAVRGTHALFLCLGALAPALLFAVARRRLPRTEAVACAVFLVAFEAWPLAALEGTRPKVATVTLGLLSMIFAASSRPGLAGFGAGAAAAAAAVCWQPGIVFIAGAASEAWAVISRHPMQHRRAWLYAFGAGLCSIPALLVSWLAAYGAFSDFVEQAVYFNVAYVERGLRPISAAIPKIFSTISSFSAAEISLLPIALIGVALAPKAVPRGILVSGLCYCALALLSFQGWPDTLLLLPMLAVLLGTGLSALAQTLWGRCAGPPAVLALALWAALTPNWQRLQTPVTFLEQRQTMASLTRDIADDEVIVAIGTPEILLHSNRGRVWPWPYFWFGVDEFAAHKMGNFDAVLEDLERLDPALITIARRWKGAHRQSFERWAAARYDQSQLAVYPHRVEPIRVYRRKRSD